MCSLYSWSSIGAGVNRGHRYMHKHGGISNLSITVAKMQWTCSQLLNVFLTASLSCTRGFTCFSKRSADIGADVAVEFDRKIAKFSLVKRCGGGSISRMRDACRGVVILVTQSLCQPCSVSDLT